MNGARSIHVSAGPILEALEARLLLDGAGEEQAIELFSVSARLFAEKDASDFGDAPSPYPTLSASDGARHFIAGPTLGASRDDEPDGQPTTAADGDDTTGSPDDEDGVTFGSTIMVGQLDASVTVNVQSAPAGARLDAWIDFNADGTWGGPFEQIADNLAVSNGDNAIVFDVPSWAVAGATYGRFRLSTAGDLGPAGAAADGEVEDYRVTIASPAVSPGVFGPQNAISTNADGARSVFAADMDGDGDMDVLSASFDDDKIAWYKNDGGGGFTEETISTNADGAWSVFAADMDGDGDMDVLSALIYDDKIAWYENNGGEVFTEHVISITAYGAGSVFAADVDGDGDMDVLSASDIDDTIAWYENDGSETFAEHLISPTADAARSVFAADVDGDGDMDVLSASMYDDTIAWYENNGGEVFTEQAISTTADGAISVFAADVDSDGDMDVLSASYYDDNIVWYENNGSEVFTEHLISPTADGASSVFAADLDGDGDMDVLSASMYDDKIAWYENNGSEVFTAHTITTAADGACSVFAADMDGDGDLDVFSASYEDDKIAWYENDVTGPSADAWYSVVFHGGIVGQAALEIPDDGTFSEPRATGVTCLRIEFSEAIDPASFTPASVRMAGNDVNGDPVDLSGIDVATANIGGDTVGIIQFTPALPDLGKYLVQIEGITGVAGNPLAGDNDRVFTALAGDATGDLRVNAIDLSYIWPRRTTLIDGVSEDQTRSDITCDGRINAIDLSAAWPRRGADMRDVPDPVLPGKLGAAETPLVTDDALAEAAAFAAMSSESPTGSASSRMDSTAAPAAVRPVGNVATAAPAGVAGVATVPVETGALEVGGETLPAGDGVLDVLSLSGLLPLPL